MCSADGERVERNTTTSNEICHLRTKPNKSKLHWALFFFVFHSEWTKKASFPLFLLLSMEVKTTVGYMMTKLSLMISGVTQKIYNIQYVVGCWMLMFLCRCYVRIKLFENDIGWRPMDQLEVEWKWKKSHIHCTRKRLFIMNENKKVASVINYAIQLDFHLHWLKSQH